MATPAPDRGHHSLDMNKVKNTLMKMLADSFPKELNMMREAKLLMSILEEGKGCIAGSFVMKAVNDCMPNAPNVISNDVDIWLENEEALEKIKHISSHLGYVPRSNVLIKPTYRRLHDYVKEICILSIGWGRNSIARELQVMVLKPGRTLEDVIRSFDVEAVQWMYTSEGVKDLSPSQDLIRQLETRITKIGPVAMDIQNYPEWIRTIYRVFKYAHEKALYLSVDSWSNIVDKLNSSLDMFISNEYLEMHTAYVNAYGDTTGRDEMWRCSRGWFQRLYRERFGTTNPPPSTLDDEYLSKQRHKSRIRFFQSYSLLYSLLKRSVPRRNMPPRIISAPDNMFALDLAQIQTLDGEDTDMPAISLPTTFFDIITLEDVSTADWLSGNNGENMIILPPPFMPVSNDNALLISRQDFNNLEQDATKMYYQCANATVGSVIRSEEFIQVPLPSMNVLITGDSYVSATDMEGCGVWRLEPTGTTLQYTASKAALDYSTPGSFVSSHHCQAGTEKEVYKLKHIDKVNVDGVDMTFDHFDDLSDAESGYSYHDDSEELEGGSGSIRKMVSNKTSCSKPKPKPKSKPKSKPKKTTTLSKPKKAKNKPNKN
jgi:hypothetical protein